MLVVKRPDCINMKDTFFFNLDLNGHCIEETDFLYHSFAPLLKFLVLYSEIQVPNWCILNGCMNVLIVKLQAECTFIIYINIDFTHDHNYTSDVYLVQITCIWYTRYVLWQLCNAFISESTASIFFIIKRSQLICSSL